MSNQPDGDSPPGPVGPAGPVQPAGQVGPEFSAYPQYPAYPSQQYPAQPYPGQPYPNQPYPNQPYPNQVYPGQPYPPYGYPYRPGTNGFAIAGFVCSFFGLIGILGIIFSCIALGQLRQRGQAGRGLAIAGLVIGSCWACFYLIALVVGLAT